jgi:hypothetical protein
VNSEVESHFITSVFINMATTVDPEKGGEPPVLTVNNNTMNVPLVVNVTDPGELDRQRAWCIGIPSISFGTIFAIVGISLIAVAASGFLTVPHYNCTYPYQAYCNGEYHTCLSNQVYYSCGTSTTLCYTGYDCNDDADDGGASGYYGGGSFLLILGIILLYAGSSIIFCRTLACNAAVVRSLGFSV